MKIWLPYVEGGSGTDVFTKSLAAELAAMGNDVQVDRFPHRYQYFPWRLRGARAPAGTEAIIANSWNAFAFRRGGASLLSVEHLCVLDPALAPYRTKAQALFHHTLVRYFEATSARSADTTVAVSRYTAGALARAIPDSNPQVILNAVDCEFFHPRPEFEGGKVFRLLFVGNLSRRKGADMLPGIMSRLGKGFELHYTAGLRAPDTMRGVGNAFALGKLDSEQVRQAYWEADALLFPTRLEGLPLVAMEAMACGIPVIASNSSSLPEVIEDGVSGRLCPQDDIVGFADATAELAADRELTRRLGAAARRVAVARFGRRRMASEYRDLLERMSVTAS